MLKWKTGITATDRIINKIICLVVETGSLTGTRVYLFVDATPLKDGLQPVLPRLGSCLPLWRRYAALPLLLRRVTRSRGNLDSCVLPARVSYSDVAFAFLDPASSQVRIYALTKL